MWMEILSTKKIQRSKKGHETTTASWSQSFIPKNYCLFAHKKQQNKTFCSHLSHFTKLGPTPIQHQINSSPLIQFPSQWQPYGHQSPYQSYFSSIPQYFSLPKLSLLLITLQKASNTAPKIMAQEGRSPLQVSQCNFSPSIQIISEKHQYYQNIVPMSKNSSPCNRFTQSHESPSNLQERSSSDFSFTKTKRSQRKTHKKKITKIVHTICFFRTDQAGRKEMTYHQHIGETALRSKEGVQRLAKRQNNDHSFKMIELQRKQTGFLKRVQKDKEVKIEEQPHVPSAFGYLPQQFYYIC